MRTSAATGCLALGLAACGSVSPERGHDDVARIVSERVGAPTRWEAGPPGDERVAAWVDEMLRAGLTADRAVQIALVSNPDLQATYESLGVSQAEMVQAGLLANPHLSFDFGLPQNRAKSEHEIQLSLVQNFLDLFVLPLRKEVAGEQFVVDALRVAHEALEIAAAVRKAYATVQAAGAVYAEEVQALAAARAVAELADRQLEAGNVTRLHQRRERAEFESARLALAMREIERAEAREHLNRLLGLWGPAAGAPLAEPLPALPPADPPLERVEGTALARRLDVDAARKSALLMSKAVDLARTSRAFGLVEVGVDAHQYPEGPRVIGMSLTIDLPIFDRRQAVIARLEGQKREAERRREAVAQNARTEVRLAAARLRVARQIAEHHERVLGPLRAEISAEAQLHFNGMLIGLPELAAAKRDEIAEARARVEALRDYWIARAELERAAGGRLPTSEETSP